MAAKEKKKLGGKVEIPRKEWVNFFDGFSRQHRSWLINLEVTQDGKKHALEARELPFQGVTVDLKHGDEDTTSITLEQGRQQYLTHTVPHTKRVLLEQTQQGADSGLTIESADGSKTMLKFRSPALPETVGGVEGGEV